MVCSNGIIEKITHHTLLIVTLTSTQNQYQLAEQVEFTAAAAREIVNIQYTSYCNAHFNTKPPACSTGSINYYCCAQESEYSIFPSLTLTSTQNHQLTAKVSSTTTAVHRNVSTVYFLL